MLSSDLRHSGPCRLPPPTVALKDVEGGASAASAIFLQASAAAYASTIADAFDPGAAEEADTSDVSAKCAALRSCAAEDGAAATNIIKCSCC